MKQHVDPTSPDYVYRGKRSERYVSDSESVVYIGIRWKTSNGKRTPQLKVYPNEFNPSLYRSRADGGTPERPHILRWVLKGYDLLEGERIVIRAKLGYEHGLDQPVYEIASGPKNSITALPGRRDSDNQSWQYNIVFVRPGVMDVTLDPIVIIKDDDASGGKRN